MKKIILFTLLVSIVIFSGCKKKKAETETDKNVKKKISKPVNIIPFEERPFVIMAPTIGREVDVTIYTLPKQASSLEYLAEYQYGTSLGGNEQFIDLSDSLPASKQFVLYSRSAGGKTSYEEDVQGGSLTLDFSEPNEYRLKQDWKYIDNKDKADTFKTKDGSFQVAGTELKTVRYAILYNSPGTPGTLPGEKLSEIYTATFTSPVKTMTVTISASGDGSIYGWTGSSWKKFDTTFSSGKATAKVDAAQAYVVVK